MKNKTNKFVLLACLSMFVITGCHETSTGLTSEAQAKAKHNTYFKINSDGSLQRPQDYRTWVYVGTPVTPNELNNGKAAFPEFHNVYIDPVSYKHYTKTGEFPQNTILMKELVSVGSKAAVSGNGYFMGEFIGLEATIKSEKHFPNEPGNWAYFSFTNPETGVLADTGKAFAAASCNSCHLGNAADDFVFTQHYPVLSAAKGFGAGVPENTAMRATIKKPTSAEPKPEQMDDQMEGHMEMKKDTMMMDGKSDPWMATAPTPTRSVSNVPVQTDALFSYLSDKTYQNFTHKEKEKHPSAGPHTQYGLPVRVFYNDTMSASLKAGSTEHPKGAAIVKEMFDADENLSGWAVMVKTHDRTDDGKGWFWYEVTSTTDSNALAATGNGVTGCSGCHTVGIDMVRSNIGAMH